MAGNQLWSEFNEFIRHLQEIIFKPNLCLKIPIKGVGRCDIMINKLISFEVKKGMLLPPLLNLKFCNLTLLCG
jgi:hypothetical protein